MVRLFIAVWPDTATSERLHHLPRPVTDGIRWSTPDQWHVTLRFLGQVDDPEAPLVRLMSAELPDLGLVAAHAGPSTLVLGPVLCLPVTGLDPLVAAVRSATEELGQPPEDRPFRGHLSLARLRGRRPSAADRRRLSALAGLPFAWTWPVDRLTLVASETRPDGARYHVLAQRPLVRT